jgi:hypothetical protein
MFDLNDEAVDDNGDKLLCCGSEQVDAIQSNLELPSTLMLRCPSCFRNFRELACQLPCSPWQSNWMTVTEHDPGLCPFSFQNVGRLPMPFQSLSLTFFLFLLSRVQIRMLF